MKDEKVSLMVPNSAASSFKSIVEKCLEFKVERRPSATDLVTKIELHREKTLEQKEEKKLKWTVLLESVTFNVSRISFCIFQTKDECVEYWTSGLTTLKSRPIAASKEVIRSRCVNKKSAKVF